MLFVLTFSVLKIKSTWKKYSFSIYFSALSSSRLISLRRLSYYGIFNQNDAFAPQVSPSFSKKENTVRRKRHTFLLNNHQSNQEWINLIPCLIFLLNIVWFLTEYLLYLCEVFCFFSLFSAHFKLNFLFERTVFPASSY